MKILLCHNYYQLRGGEDQCFEDEGALLESRGHEVLRYTRHNDDIPRMSSIQAARQTLWSRRTYRELRDLLASHRPDVVHFTNTFPLISPAAYYAARAESVPVVQAVHNFRLLCPGGAFSRNEHACEKCLHRRFPWPALLHKCYRQHRMATLAVATLVGWQRFSRMMPRLVSRFYTLSAFARQKLVEGGLPSDRIDVKPNFLFEDPVIGAGGGGYVAFVGRLSPEKGLTTMLQAWAARPEMPRLRILGDGPMALKVQEACRTDSRIQWLGRKPLDEVCRILAEASCLVMPSVGYETFGRTVMEALAVGTPVVASRLGAVPELVTEGRTGVTFRPGDKDDLAEKVIWTLSDRERLDAMRQAAREEFEAKYTAEANYRMLRQIYEKAAGTPMAASDVAATAVAAD